MDKYQERYLAHQQRKAEVLKQIVADRHSDRRFGSRDIDITPVLESLKQVPSSCDRRGVEPHVVSDRDTKNILSGLLVGGVGWIHRASHIVMLFAAQEAYKAADEVTYMPYIDAGVMVQQAYLTATANDIACTYVNPNVREQHRPLFRLLFGEKLFCGAIALGSRYDS